jgi:hypothetical protein
MQRLLVLSVCVLCCAPAGKASASDPVFPLKKNDTSTIPIPWQDLSEKAVTLSKSLLEKPTVQARGPAETFSCTPEQYYWLLDNPDRAVLAWRKLGAKCVSIQRRGPNKFGYVDEMGSDIAWETIHQGPGVRIWFAEGKVKASAVLPLVPVKALVVLRHAEGKMPDGNIVVQHQTDLVIHTDSKAAAGVTKLMGQTAPKLAEQGLSQLQLFFSALSCYVDRHPERVETLFPTETTQAPMKR